jgi:hypothetical protein
MADLEDIPDAGYSQKKVKRTVLELEDRAPQNAPSMRSALY